MTLKITVREESNATTLRLDGRVAGPWVGELDRTWRSLPSSPGPKRVVVDLCGVTDMDVNGRRVLADIHKGTGADFLADSPMTKYFAAEARRKNKNVTEEEA